MNSIDLNTLFSSTQSLLESAFSPLQITLSLMMTLIMVLFVYYIYKKTYTGVLYSKNFNITLVVTALVVNAIMMGISGNVVLSLGLVGALSIIRFRTAVKDPKDTAFLFWSITIGVINGVAYYELSFIASIFIGVVLFFFSRQQFNQQSYVLIVKHSTDAFAALQTLLDEHFTPWSIRSDSHSSNGIEKVIEVQIKGMVPDMVLQTMRELHGIESVTLLSSSGDFSE